MAILASFEHGSVAVVVRPGDVLLSAHLVQPLADRQVAIPASPEHGSEASIIRPGDVLGRAVVVEPLAHIQLTLEARLRHRGLHKIGNLLRAAQVSGLQALLHEPRSHRLQFFRRRRQRVRVLGRVSIDQHHHRSFTIASRLRRRRVRRVRRVQARDAFHRSFVRSSVRSFVRSFGVCFLRPCLLLLFLCFFKTQ